MLTYHSIKYISSFLVIIQMLHNKVLSQTLSRKKRYLVFPEGSSLQLVFCFTTPTLDLDNIFTLTNTAAMAWELPSQSKFSFFSNQGNKVLQTTEKSTSGWNNTYYNWNDIIHGSQSYDDPFLSKKNYNFVDRSKFFNTIPYSTTNKRLDNSVNSQRNLLTQNQKVPINVYVPPMYHTIYRRTRRDLYVKIEKFLNRLKVNGKACLLKLICTFSKGQYEMNEFMIEIFKAVFSIKIHGASNDLNEYDKATTIEDCNRIYENCKFTFN